ncbi:uncharacterized protein [Panulirus ornatus]|uniref:uncharacterized protein n=1 Tax=Panulirus ornatus TaxID=150431 RepID=UPI003A89E778
MGQLFCSCRWICRIMDGIAELVSPPTKRKHRVERVWWAQPCLQQLRGDRQERDEEDVFHVCELLVTSVDHNNGQTGKTPNHYERVASMGEEVYEEWTPAYLRHNSNIF